jgi:hypothetical protein
MDKATAAETYVHIHAQNEFRNHYDRVQAVDKFIHPKLDHKATDIGISLIRVYVGHFKSSAYCMFSL